MPEPRVISFREALREAMVEEMERDPSIFLMGEEVGHYNGAYKVSEGMLARFGEARVIDTPIAETGFAGVGIGAAMIGLRPIIEFMTWNFSLTAIDQLINNAAKLRYMADGQFTLPIVFRGRGGDRRVGEEDASLRRRPGGVAFRRRGSRGGGAPRARCLRRPRRSARARDQPRRADALRAQPGGAGAAVAGARDRDRAPAARGGGDVGRTHTSGARATEAVARPCRSTSPCRSSPTPWRRARSSSGSSIRATASRSVRSSPRSRPTRPTWSSRPTTRARWPRSACRRASRHRSAP